jgi:hypothetical protein
MPQFNSYPEVSELVAADLVLMYKTTDGAVKTITGESLAASIKALTDKSYPITNVNSATSLTSDDEFVVGNSGSAFILTLPLAADNPGLPIYIANKGLGTITVDTVAPDTIFGAASVPIAQYKGLLFISDGDEMWTVFGVTA